MHKLSAFHLLVTLMCAGTGNANSSHIRTFFFYISITFSAKLNVALSYKLLASKFTEIKA